MQDCTDAILECELTGHSLIRRFCDENELLTLCEEVKSIHHDIDKHDYVMHFMHEEVAGEKQLIRSERIWEAIPSLSNGVLGEKLFKVAQQYIKDEVSVFKDKINVRRAGSPGFVPHQDTTPGWNNFGDNFLSITIFLNQSTPENGGFEVVDKKHRVGRIKHKDGVIPQEKFNKLDPHSIIAEAGDALLLDGDTPHSSLANTRDIDTSHLIITFCQAKSSSARNDYYTKKAVDFDGDPEKNVYQFRSTLLVL